MKKFIYLILLCSAAISAATSCYEDKGNYDYRTIGTVTVEGIDPSLERVAYLDDLEITPTVTSTATPVDKLEYVWTMSLSYSNPNNEILDIKMDTLARTKDLSMPVELYPGDYYLYFRVEDPATNIYSYTTTTLKVTTEYMTGFYVTKEVAGNATDVDLFRPKDAEDNYPAPILNIIANHEGAPMPGKPVSTGFSTCYAYYRPEISDYEYIRSLNISTENDIRIYSTVDMQVLYSHQTMFMGEVPTDEKPLYLRNQGANVGYLSTKGYYSSYQFLPWMNGSGKFGYVAPINDKYASEDPYQPNPNCMMICQDEYTLGFFFFDELKGRFLMSDFNGQVKTFEYKPTDTYKPEGIEDKLIYYGGNRIGSINNAYAVFEDADDPSVRHLYLMKPDIGAMSNPISEVLTLTPGTPMNDATLYAVSEMTANMLYFVYDNQFYIYNPADGSGADTPVALEGMGSGETITYIVNRTWTSGDSINYLIIGTEKEGKYKVYLYPRIGAYPDGGPVRILEGEGKISSVHYASSLMGPGSYQYYSGSM